MGNTIISIRGLNKSYGKHEVLKNINLDIQEGEIYGLVGKNGAGKTTLFKVLLGLSDYQHGEMQIGFNKEKPLEGRKDIGFFIGSNFFPKLTAAENLEYYRRLKSIEDKGEIERVLKIVGLAGVKSKYKSFSLGMKQRLGIANAILGNPKILFLDEPVNGLDPQGIADIRMLIQELNKDYGMTVIVSSHILGELQHTAHSFGIVHNGTIARVVSEKDLLEEQNMIQISVDDLAKAKELLLGAGINVYKEIQMTKSLEDFYFDIVGREG